MVAGFASNHTYMQGKQQKIKQSACKSNFLRRSLSRDKLEAETISTECYNFLSRVGQVTGRIRHTYQGVKLCNELNKNLKTVTFIKVKNFTKKNK